MEKSAKCRTEGCNRTTEKDWHYCCTLCGLDGMKKTAAHMGSCDQKYALEDARRQAHLEMISVVRNYHETEHKTMREILAKSEGNPNYDLAKGMVDSAYVSCQKLYKKMYDAAGIEAEVINHVLVNMDNIKEQEEESTIIDGVWMRKPQQKKPWIEPEIHDQRIGDQL